MAGDSVVGAMVVVLFNGKSVTCSVVEVIVVDFHWVDGVGRGGRVGLVGRGGRVGLVVRCGLVG